MESTFRTVPGIVAPSPSLLRSPPKVTPFLPLQPQRLSTGAAAAALIQVVSGDVGKLPDTVDLYLRSLLASPTGRPLLLTAVKASLEVAGPAVLERYLTGVQNGRGGLPLTLTGVG